MIDFRGRINPGVYPYGFKIEEDEFIIAFQKKGSIMN